jgi:hypothetical protein
MLAKVVMQQVKSCMCERYSRPHLPYFLRTRVVGFREKRKLEGKGTNWLQHTRTLCHTVVTYQKKVSEITRCLPYLMTLQLVSFLYVMKGQLNGNWITLIYFNMGFCHLYVDYRTMSSKSNIGTLNEIILTSSVSSVNKMDGVKNQKRWKRVPSFISLPKLLEK